MSAPLLHDPDPDPGPDLLDLADDLAYAADLLLSRMKPKGIRTREGFAQNLLRASLGTWLRHRKGHGQEGAEA